ncbi:NADPH-dependent F420 reductase [Peterkaempfera sp. SMS 1(5)a]|uniref:NADPH-dependent F420 reductase n=1 Tax=Peterkaempfera podocarpi TaxID=3232308 RepID=UPI003670BE29
MRFAVIGTGAVGRTLAGRLLALGHEVALGSRSKDNAAAPAWAEEAGPAGQSGTFADAAAFGETVVNATSGTVSLQALTAAGAGNLAGKVLIDVSNPLVFGADGDVTLDPVDTDSIGERIQRAFPEALVVKSLNTCNVEVMVDPARVPGEHNVFVAGDDDGAKRQVTQLLQDSAGRRVR